MQDPKKRATADAILQHSWMKENGTASDRPLDNVIVKRMQGFLHMNKLKKEALKVMATGMSPEEIAGLRSLFQVSTNVRRFMIYTPDLYSAPHHTCTQNVLLEKKDCQPSKFVVWSSLRDGSLSAQAADECLTLAEL